MERSADRALYLPSGDWRVLKRVRRHGTGEIKVSLAQVDAVREGQGHAGSNPATSTIFHVSGCAERSRDIACCCCSACYVCVPLCPVWSDSIQAQEGAEDQLRGPT